MSTCHPHATHQLPQSTYPFYHTGYAPFAALPPPSFAPHPHSNSQHISAFGHVLPSKLAPSPMKIDGGGAALLHPAPGPRQMREINLENHDKATNIYIRLLPPDARDSDLKRLGSRFGQVLSVRALLSTSIKPDVFGVPREDTSCKGVGFILYKSAEEAERAVVGLNAEGFEVSYAKESVSLKLRRLADENSTNLYLTNLPYYFENHDVVQLLAPATVLSVRILRENDALPSDQRGDGGASKGIGFARLEDRDIADSVISRLNGLHLPGSGLPLRIRYADSREQRELKQQIGENRTRRLKAINDEDQHSPPCAAMGRLRPFASSPQSPSPRDSPLSSIFDTPTRVINGSASMQWSANVSPASSMNISPTKPPRAMGYFDRPAPPVFVPHLHHDHPAFYTNIKPSQMAFGPFNSGFSPSLGAPSPVPHDPNFAVLAEQEAQAFYGNAPSPFACKTHAIQGFDDLSSSTDGGAGGETESSFSFGSGGALSGSGGCLGAGVPRTRFVLGEEGEQQGTGAVSSTVWRKRASLAEAIREGNGPGTDAWLMGKRESRKSLP